MPGAVSAHGIQPIFGIRPVEDLFAFDPGLFDLGVDAEGIAVEDNEIGVFAGASEPMRCSSPIISAPASVSPSSAFSRDMPARTAIAAMRKKTASR